MRHPGSAGLTLALLLLGQPAQAHWCNNIWTAPSRLMVKPEKNSLVVGASPATLRVYLQNNFPYRLFNVRLRGVAAGYTITVDPPSTTGQHLYPGQNVSYLFTVSGPSGSVPVSSLDLQVRFRVTNGSGSSWRNSSDCVVDQSPSQSLLVSGSSYGTSICNMPNQHASLTTATLADNHPAATLGAGAPFFGRTAIQQLVHLFGYRFCYNTGGSYRCGSQACPGACPDLNNPSFGDWSSIEQFPQNCMRAGVEIAARKSTLGSNLTAARDAAVNGLKHSGGGGGSAEHKCLAALVGGYLWQGVAAPNAFTAALQNSAYGVPAGCQSAGLRALDGSNGSGCTSGSYYVRAACAAAEGLRGNYGPVQSVLMPNAGDGNSSGSYDSLYYAYMLYIVQAHLKATSGTVPFYPDAGGPILPSPDGAAPPPDSTVTPPPDSTVTPPPDSTVTPPPDSTMPPDGPLPPAKDSASTGDSAPIQDGLTVDQAPGADVPVGDAPAMSEGGPPLPQTPDRILEGGCGCATARPAGVPAPLFGLILLALLGLTRRR